jgi:hypothetical protein
MGMVPSWTGRVAGTPVPPFLSRDGQDIVHENPEQKYLNANKIIEIQKSWTGTHLKAVYPPLKII